MRVLCINRSQVLLPEDVAALYATYGVATSIEHVYSMDVHHIAQALDRADVVWCLGAPAEVVEVVAVSGVARIVRQRVPAPCDLSERRKKLASRQGGFNRSLLVSFSPADGV